MGVFTYMPNLYAFHAVVGYFRASGYFAIREHLNKISKVRILVGINVDNMIAEAQRRGLMFFGDDKKTREEFLNWMQEDIKQARYDKKVEDGILQFMDDIIENKIEIRAHTNKKLHSKIYIFLPEQFNEHSSGTVITGSSNLTDAGLGKNYDRANYEFNVELRDYEDVKFANDEFEKLWNESTDILPEDFNKIKEKTHLGKEFTPFEIYIKFLIEYFGKNIEYDPETITDVPNNFKKLSYQVDAVTQGFNMLLDHNGFFLADVVGTGKTVVAAMLAKRFILANGGQHTKILVVYPPALEKNWKRTFRLFGITRYTDFISNGSLDKIVNGDSLNYSPKEEYDLVLIDEAHKFRNHTSQMFENLQLICKAGRINEGMIEGRNKKIVLISATPINNRPQDIYHQLSLFQNVRRSTLDTNLQSFFGKIDVRYRKIKKDADINVNEVRKIYKDIRENVLQKVTVRRTRKDLEKIDLYRIDLEEQEIKFPKIEPPAAREYKLDNKLNDLFYKTIKILMSDEGLLYYRYQAIKFLIQEYKELYENADLVSRSLAYIIKTQLVKRLESSFYAFKISLNRMRISTDNMIKMFKKDKVFIAPDLDINKLIEENHDDEDIEELILQISEEKPANRIFKAKDFEKDFIKGLIHDKTLLDELCEEWKTVNYDPKFDVFLDLMEKTLFDKKNNPTGKLVIFSESKDTTHYLTKELDKHGYKNILTISSLNRKNMFEKIMENFDANYDKEHKDDYSIIISTEVMAEGVNLHRANVVVNYDTPWNATRLMQRIGRLNRIGSIAGKIYNYNFYPSSQGEEQIKLKRTAYMKLQGFHSAYGEDSQIYTLDEIIEQFKLYQTGDGEEEDIRLEYLEFIRNFRRDSPKQFKEIKSIPLKARTAREGFEAETEKDKKLNINEHSICYLKEGKKKEIYLVGKDKKIYPLIFELAAKIFEAKEDEKSKPLPDSHYEQISLAVSRFEQDMAESGSSEFTVTEKADARTNNVKKMLRTLRKDAVTDEFDEIYDELAELLTAGTYLNLTTELERIRKKKLKPMDEEKEVLKVARKYISNVPPDDILTDDNEKIKISEPEIIISESFI